MKISAIILAAGKGVRARLGVNKALAPLFGAPVLYHSLKKFAPLCNEIIVAANEDDLRETDAICAHFGAKVVIGGKERFDSVLAALKECTGEAVLIHDGARPFVTEDIIKRCIDGVIGYGSAIAAVPASDTVAVCEDGEITSVPPRKSAYLLQTPQCFRYGEILDAYQRAIGDGKTYTDDSSVYARYIGKPHICEGDRENIKLTYKEDFLKFSPPLPTVDGKAIGYGADVHAFGEGNEITLCGVKIPHSRALIAHSDGDVPVHAIMDACLSAAGLKDIGNYFPDTDDKFFNADSLQLLKNVVQLIGERNLQPVGVSVSVQAEEPRLSPYIDDMKKNIADVCGIPVENVGISAGTCEKLGFVGERLGIAASAIVVLKSKE